MAFTLITTLVPGVKPRRFSSKGYLHFNVRLSIRGTGNDKLAEIQMVVYELDPTFENRYVVSANRKDAFAIELWTYGWFDLSAKLITADNRVLNVSGRLEWEGPPFPEDEDASSIRTAKRRSGPAEEVDESDY